jgi:hypothetical protein
VTDPAELTHTVLLRVAEFIRRLPTDQLADLAEGTAKLELVPKGGRPAPRSRATAAAKPAIPAEQVRADLVAIGETAAARQYVADLRLTVAQLKTLAKELEVAVASSAKKDEILDKIAYVMVGRRANSDVIGRPAPSLG